MYGIKMVFSSRYLAKDKICRNKVPSFFLDLNYFLFYKMQFFIVDMSRVQYAVRTQHFSHFPNKIKDLPLYPSLVHPERGYCWSSNRHDKIRREALAWKQARSSCEKTHFHLEKLVALSLFPLSCDPCAKVALRTPF